MTDERTAEEEVRHLLDAEVDAFLRRDPVAIACSGSDDLVVTALWMRQTGRWQEIIRHANVVPPQ